MDDFIANVIVVKIDKRVNFESFVSNFIVIKIDKTV